MMRTKVLIVGGGPAGATAARVLAGSNIETVLVERDFSYIKPCGGGIPSTAFSELDIPETAVKKKVHRISIKPPDGEKIDIELPGGALCITERGRFDAGLRKLAIAGGAFVMEGSFSRFEETGKNITSVIRSKTTQEELRIKSDYVIAADGITSAVAASLHLPGPHAIHTLSVHMKATHEDSCEFWFGTEHASNFYSWVFPSGEYLSVGTGSSNPKDLIPFLDTFTKKRFNTPFTELAGSNGQSLSCKTRAFKIPEWQGTRFNIDNIFFAGDAAGTVMPVTYEGIYYAMKSGEFAARAIIEGNPDHYKKLWNGRFRTRFLLMSKVRQHLFRDNNSIQKWVALHKRPDVQELAVKLWLHKSRGRNGILTAYTKIFRHFFRM